MFKTCKTESTIRPEKFESLNNGIWYYNYDITERVDLVPKHMSESEELEEQTIYSYVQVRISGQVTVDKCWEAILKAFKNESNTTLYNYNLGPSKDAESEALADEIYYNVRVDFGLEEPLTELEKAKKVKIREIDKYDTSVEVNSFFLNGLQVWLNKDTRVGLMNSLTIEKNAGKEDSTLWFNNICVVVKCDAAMQMLSALELYALECYNKTAEHKVAVETLTSLEAVENYDYTTGYPTKLNFTIE